MSKTFNRVFDPGSHTNLASAGLFLIRIAAGVFMFSNHGLGKLTRLFGEGPIKFSDPIGIGPEASLALAAFAEAICSVLIILGLATRLSAIPLIITMMVAAFIAHADDPFLSRELPLLYGSIFIAFALAGAGKYSLDNLIYKNKKQRKF